MGKPREFWIDTDPRDADKVFTRKPYPSRSTDDEYLVHVIEMSAYQALAEQLAKAEERAVRMLFERDQYAKLFQLVLQEGIFANKAGLIRKIESMVAEIKDFKAKG